MSEPASYPDRAASGELRSVLVVSSDPDERRALCDALRRTHAEVGEARGATEALEKLEARPFEVVVAMDRLRHDCGVALLARVRELWPRTARIMVSDEPVLATQAINEAGICYLLPTAWDHSSLDAALDSTFPVEPIVRPRGVAREAEPVRFHRILGESLAMKDLLGLVGKVAQTDSTVLVTGETGSGKELIGRAVHDASRRRDRVFSAVNSAAFPETLLESELFGHRRGSFTGASANAKGLFESADKGTVFLDEVAEMPLSMQAKLLRFLQTGEIRPIGSETTRFVDVRLVAATNKDLVEEVAKGNFREDLYYRLAVIPLHVPPLRERKDDISLLARHFLSRFAERSGQPAEYLDPSAVEVLQAHDWPGNVRELENVIERAVALSRDGRIDATDLPRFRRSVSVPSVEGPVESLPVLERRHIIETLDRVGWNRKRAAELLQISTTTLWRRLKEFGIDGKQPRGAVISKPLEASSAAGR